MCETDSAACQLSPDVFNERGPSEGQTPCQDGVCTAEEEEEPTLSSSLLPYPGTQHHDRDHYRQHTHKHVLAYFMHTQNTHTV